MISFNPVITALAERLRAERLAWIVRMAEEVASRPAIGVYEVGLLQELSEDADEISGAREQRERQADLRRYHWSGRAVDMPPRRSALEVLLRDVAEARPWLFPRAEPYVHWAWDSPWPDRQPARPEESGYEGPES